jgi:hypothetical protein
MTVAGDLPMEGQPKQQDADQDTENTNAKLPVVGRAMCRCVPRHQRHDDAKLCLVNSPVPNVVERRRSPSLPEVDDPHVFTVGGVDVARVEVAVCKDGHITDEHVRALADTPLSGLCDVGRASQPP